MTRESITLFKDAHILRDNQLVKDDLWVRNGKIIRPESTFFEEKILPNYVYFCNGKIISPGFIDVQINGAYGIDFSQLSPETAQENVDFVATNIVKHGVTSIVPTIITSPAEYYHKIIPQITKSLDNHDKANILGLHLEGPFINPEKKGIHNEKYIAVNQLSSNQNTRNDKLNNNHQFVFTYEHFEHIYGRNFDLTKQQEKAAITESNNRENSFLNAKSNNVVPHSIAIISLAPELPGMPEIIQKLTHEKGIVVSLGHSMANLEQGLTALKHGATFITHLFNAMLPFHHRDPGLVGLLTAANNSLEIMGMNKHKTSEILPLYFGMITDGIHTNPAAINIAQRTYNEGLCIITDAIVTMGLDEININQDSQDGPTMEKLLKRYESMDEQIHYTFGGKDIIYDAAHKTALSKQHTIAGGMTPFDACVRTFIEATGCSIVEALKCATLHPAQLLGLSHKKGTLNFGADADLVVLNGNDLTVCATFVQGHLCFSSQQANILSKQNHSKDESITNNGKNTQFYNPKYLEYLRSFGIDFCIL